MREGLLAARACGGPATGPDGLQLPPSRLRLLVDGRSGDAHHFSWVGYQMSTSIREAVAAAGVAPEDLGAILDFGCGCGRVTRYWAADEGLQVHGCDYNEELIGWCKSNLPFVHTARNEVEPPTEYASQSFDLIYALSVLSHLDESLQFAWVAEFRRLLRPGGILIVSVLGDALRYRLTRDEQKRFDRGELVVERPRMAGHNACTAYHPHRYVTERLLADFHDVRSFDLGSPGLALMQDAYIARHPGMVPDSTQVSGGRAL